MNCEELNNKSDEDILELSIKAPSAFEILVDRYQEAFIRTAEKIVRHKEEAEDATQETFIKIYKNANKFKKVEGAGFKSWAYKILTNTAINHYKKLKINLERFENYDPQMNDFIDNSAKDNADVSDAKNFIYRVFEKLPLHLKSVMNKYYMEDKSQRIIAKEENISAVAVKMRLFRAKKAFKKVAADISKEKILLWKI